MVLSQFCTVTVCRAMSITSPSAFWLGISIQSPIRTRPSPLICRLAANERIVSWNTSISTALAAPRPVSTCSRFTPARIAIAISAASTYSTILATCR